jgi:RNA polymerase sigma-70 factor (ECF subfamily)
MIDNSDDKVKFEKVYKNFKNIMLNRAYEIVKERQLAEDAVHNAFLKIINNLPKIYDADSNETKWYVIVIVTNEAKKIYNKENKILKAELTDMESDFNLEAIVEDKNIVEKVKKEIGLLPEIYRDTMSLKYYNDLSNKEISSVLSIPISTVKKRLQRGRKILIQKLGEKNND